MNINTNYTRPNFGKVVMITEGAEENLKKNINLADWPEFEKTIKEQQNVDKVGVNIYARNKQQSTLGLIADVYCIDENDRKMIPSKKMMQNFWNSELGFIKKVCQVATEMQKTLNVYAHRSEFFKNTDRLANLKIEPQAKNALKRNMDSGEWDVFTSVEGPFAALHKQLENSDDFCVEIRANSNENDRLYADIMRFDEKEKELAVVSTVKERHKDSFAFIHEVLAAVKDVKSELEEAKTKDAIFKEIKG